MAPCEIAEFLRWKEQLPVVAETSIGKRNFKISRDETELHSVAYASQGTKSEVACQYSQPQQYSAELVFVIGKCRMVLINQISLSGLKPQAAVMTVRLKEQIDKELEIKQSNQPLGTQEKGVTLSVGFVEGIENKWPEQVNLFFFLR